MLTLKFHVFAWFILTLIHSVRKIATTQFNQVNGKCESLHQVRQADWDKWTYESSDHWCTNVVHPILLSLSLSLCLLMFHTPQMWFRTAKVAPLVTTCFLWFLFTFYQHKTSHGGGEVSSTNLDIVMIQINFTLNEMCPLVRHNESSTLSGERTVTAYKREKERENTIRASNVSPGARVCDEVADNWMEQRMVPLMGSEEDFTYSSPACVDEEAKKSWADEREREREGEEDLTLVEAFDWTIFSHSVVSLFVKRTLHLLDLTTCKETQKSKCIESIVERETERERQV